MAFLITQQEALISQQKDYRHCYTNAVFSDYFLLSLLSFFLLQFFLQQEGKEQKQQEMYFSEQQLLVAPQLFQALFIHSL